MTFLLVEGAAATRNGDVARGPDGEILCVTLDVLATFETRPEAEDNCGKNEAVVEVL